MLGVFLLSLKIFVVFLSIYLQMNTDNMAFKAQELCDVKLAMKCAIITEVTGAIKSMGFL